MVAAKPLPTVGVSRAALDRVVHIAEQAAAAAMRFYGSESGIEMKSDASPVTLADRAAHETIVRALEDWDERVPVVSEEAVVPPYDERAAWRRLWLVDPLDGTKEFIAGNGEFTVNIALIEDGEPVLGAIVAPARSTAYFAGRSLGAWRRDADGRTTLLMPGAPIDGRIRIVESRSHPSPQLEAFVSSLGSVERIRLGSSLKFCKVAEGSADLYPRFGRTMEWDIAAGDCIYRAARPGLGVACAKYNQATMSIPEFVIGMCGCRSDGAVARAQ